MPSNLSDSELFEVLRDLIARANTMMSVATPDGHMMVCNEHWQKVLGHPLSAYLGVGWRDLTHPEDVEDSKRNLAALAYGVSIDAHHSRLRNSDGEYRWLRWDCWNTANGLLVATAVDVTQDFEAHRQLRHLEQLREATEKLARIGVFELDLRTGVVRTSREIHRIREVDEDFEFSFEVALSFYPQPGRDQLRALMHRAIDRQMPWDLELPLITSSGAHLWVRNFGRVQVDDSGQPARLIGGVQDVTERRAKDLVLAEAVRSAEETALAQSEFMAAMSHEIRNPLHALLNIQTLLAKTPLNQDQHRLVRLMEETGGTLSSLLDRVLQLSRLESGKMDPVSLPLDLVAICANSVASLAPTRPDLEVRVEGLERLTVQGDPGQLRQIVDNLVSNALRYTLAGSVRVHISTTSQGQEIQVTDTGRGIDSTRHEVIFERFRRVDPESDRFEGGTGLGLSIARALARGMGGDLSVRSELNRGSTFTLSLNCPAASLAHTTEEPVVQRRHFPAGTRVLVVDDEPVGRYVARRLMEQWNLVVLEASDGAAAIEIALREQPSLVFMDCIMPHTDGWTAARQLRDRGFQQPILALSGSGTEVDIARAFNAGMNDHLCKPVRAPELHGALSFWLRTDPSGQEG